MTQYRIIWSYSPKSKPKQSIAYPKDRIERVLADMQACGYFVHYLKKETLLQSA